MGTRLVARLSVKPTVRPRGLPFVLALLPWPAFHRTNPLRDGSDFQTSSNRTSWAASTAHIPEMRICRQLSRNRPVSASTPLIFLNPDSRLCGGLSYKNGRGAWDGTATTSSWRRTWVISVKTSYELEKVSKRKRCSSPLSSVSTNSFWPSGPLLFQEQ